MPTVKEWLAGMLTGVTAIAAGIDTPVLALALLNVLDLASGLLRAGINGEVDSGVCGRGAKRKVMMWLVVAAAAVADVLIGQGDYARTVLLTTFCTTEIISIIENAALSGLPVPPILRQALAKLRGMTELEFTAKTGGDTK